MCVCACVCVCVCGGWIKGCVGVYKGCMGGWGEGRHEAQAPSNLVKNYKQT